MTLKQPERSKASIVVGVVLCIKCKMEYDLEIPSLGAKILTRKSSREKPEYWLISSSLLLVALGLIVQEKWRELKWAPSVLPTGGIPRLRHLLF